MLKQIEHPEKYEVVKFNGVDSTSVYLGFFDNLLHLRLVWRKEKIFEIGEEWECLTLDEIKEQVCAVWNTDKPIITIFIQEPFKGTILQYGNYGDSWWEIGETCGYA
jgi:hypothetical protein